MELNELLTKVVENNKELHELSKQLEEEHEIILCGIPDGIHLFAGINKISGRSWITKETDRFHAGTKIVQHGGLRFYQMGNAVEKDWTYR